MNELHIPIYLHFDPMELAGFLVLDSKKVADMLANGYTLKPAIMFKTEDNSHELLSMGLEYDVELAKRINQFVTPERRMCETCNERREKNTTKTS